MYICIYIYIYIYIPSADRGRGRAGGGRPVASLRGGGLREINKVN